MLESHLIAQTSPFAQKENIVFWEDYRVTVLQNRLFRIEHNAKRCFRDGATQSVWFRDMPPQRFSVHIEEGQALIQTQDCTLILRKRRKDCRILLDGKELPISNEGNLLGTYRTLDGFDGEIFRENGKKIRLGYGVCSRTGVAFFDDAHSLTLGSDGEVKGERGLGTDEYVFAYGLDYRAAVRALFLITGKVPLVPRFALGNWWSRYHIYTDREYLRILNRFEENEIPLTVATVDMDWHYSENILDELKIPDKEGRGWWGFGWTGYTWNKNLFPDHRAFLKEIGNRGLKITLNLHPSDGVRYWEERYSAMAKALGKDPSAKEPIAFDIANPDFINSYFSVLHRPYEKEGVSFWWIDWQQGTTSALEGLDPLWSLNHYHYLDNAAEHTEPLILSRYSGVGSHRYPLGFSGDTYTTWRTLAYLPYFTATASNIGYCWWSHDIGGHQQGIKSGELYARFIELGVFSPVNRLHCCNFETVTKEPWVYENGMGRIAADYLRLRHRLIPYLYTMSYRLHCEGSPLIEPLYYRHPAQEEAYRAKNEFYFGSELLVVPAVTKAQKDGYARIPAWLPEGRWTDFFTGDYYDIPAGGRQVILHRTVDDFPVLAKEGAFVPLSLDRGNGVGNPARLEWRVYLGDGRFELYEDDRATGGKNVFFTRLIGTKKKGGERIVITSEGEAGMIPARTMLLTFPQAEEGEVAVFCDGERITPSDRSSDCLKVEFPFETGREYVIEMRYNELTPLERTLRRAKEIITRAEGENEMKRKEYDKIRAAKTLEEYLTLVEDSALSPIARARLKETIIS